MIRNRTDPWWDLEGAGVKRARTRHRVIGGVALALAIAASGLTAATWYRLLEPVVVRLLG